MNSRGIAVKFPPEAGDFLLLHKVLTGPRSYSASYPIVLGVVFQGVKRPRCKVHLHLEPRLKIRGSICPFSIRLHGVDI
jgi:hypothetical protein